MKGLIKEGLHVVREANKRAVYDLALALALGRQIPAAAARRNASFIWLFIFNGRSHVCG